MRQAQVRFIHAERKLGRKCVVLDIPLYFESGGQRGIDAVIVASAPAFLQRQRVLKRAGMTQERLTSILSRQWPDARKRRHADAVILTGLGKASSFRQVKQLMRVLA